MCRYGGVIGGSLATSAPWPGAGPPTERSYHRVVSTPSLLSRVPSPSRAVQRLIAGAAVVGQAGLAVTGAVVRVTESGLGCTTWEVTRSIVIPYTRVSVAGGIMLGLGRALGETMAVTFVIGNFNQLDSISLFQPANSITSALANEFAEASSGMHQAALIYLGLVLFFITFVVLALSKLLLARLRRAEGARS